MCSLYGFLDISTVDIFSPKCFHISLGIFLLFDFPYSSSSIRSIPLGESKVGSDPISALIAVQYISSLLGSVPPASVSIVKGIDLGLHVILKSESGCWIDRLRANTESAFFFLRLYFNKSY